MSDLTRAVKNDIDELYKRLHLLRDGRDVLKAKLYEMEREIVGLETQITNKCYWTMEKEKAPPPMPYHNNYSHVVGHKQTKR